MFETLLPGFFLGRRAIPRLLQLLLRFEQYLPRQFRLFILLLFANGNEPPQNRPRFQRPSISLQVNCQR